MYLVKQFITNKEKMKQLMIMQERSQRVHLSLVNHALDTK